MRATTPLLAHVAPTLFNVTPPTWGELGVYAAAVATLVGVIYTATATRRTGREANAITAAEKLWKRVDELEKRDRARDEADRARDEADQAKDRRMDGLEESQRKTDSKLAETLVILSIAVDFIGELYKWGRKGGGEPEPTIPGQLREWLGHLLHKKEV